MQCSLGQPGGHKIISGDRQIIVEKGVQTQDLRQQEVSQDESPESLIAAPPPEKHKAPGPTDITSCKLRKYLPDFYEIWIYIHDHKKHCSLLFRSEVLAHKSLEPIMRSSNCCAFAFHTMDSGGGRMGRKHQ